ncbi:MAG TPA: rRNA maturation RNase YbeY [Acidobacteriota bacterium]|nr:rRNA maturation RNase YbeY [Acidobacteriota bacterium]
MRRFAASVWAALEKKQGRALPETEVSLVLLNNRQMQWYNHAYRMKDSPTDVLSFPVNEFTQEGRHYLGDILISVEKAAEQAVARKHSLDRELQILMLHGMLHLLGYDHERDSGEMDRLESKLRKAVLSGSRWVRPTGRQAGRR